MNSTLNEKKIKLFIYIGMLRRICLIGQISQRHCYPLKYCKFVINAFYRFLLRQFIIIYIVSRVALMYLFKQSINKTIIRDNVIDIITKVEIVTVHWLNIIIYLSIFSIFMLIVIGLCQLITKIRNYSLESFIESVRL